jgi:tetratricopeptide (TPR) repeat protein
MTQTVMARWGTLSPLLDGLLDADDATRSAELERIRQEHPALAHDLERMLARETEIERAAFLEGSALDVMQTAEAGALIGTVVAGYTLDRLLGQGGMGSVWLAHRSDGRFEGKAAVKFLDLALLGHGGAERFRREGSALARLAHSNIARLLDAGVTASGRPFLILEYVDGVALDRWCNEHALGVRARVQLMREVLTAVAHAHRNLVLHRDLKPSNILVTADGQVKLLDFGIAKLLGDETGPVQATELTQVGRAFTPDYAAPEQVQGRELTTATDVYALGVLLYALLGGGHPTARPADPPVDRLRAVVETEPQRLSDAVVHERAVLRGDLDNIVAKALKKAPGERYATADAFADDLRRYLDHEPVSARADSFGYRIARFVRRHRLAVGVASLALLALIGGAAGTTWQAVSAARERDRAIGLLMRNEALIAFVNVMLTEAAQSNRPITVRELLERSRALIAGSGSGNADIDVAVLTMLANFFLTFGEPVTAESLLANAHARLLPASDPALRANVLCGHAYAAALQGRLDEAQASFAQALPLARAQPTAEIECLRFRAYVARDNNDAKATLSDTQQALALLRDSGRATPLAEADLLGDLAYSHYLFGNAADADRTYALAVDRFRAAGRGDGPSVVILLNNWGIASFAAGDVQRAFASYDDALRIATRLTAEGEPPVYLLANRGIANATLARYDAAIADFRRAHAQAVATGNSASIASSLAGMAAAYREKGDPVRAAALLSEARGLIGKSVPAGSVPTISIKQIEARVALLDGRWSEARAAYDEIIEFFDARNMRVGPVVTALRGRAEAHLHDGALDRAATDLDRALKMARALQGDKPYSSHVGLSLAVLHRLQLARGDVDNARRTATEAVVHLTGALGEDHPEARRTRLALDR